MKKSNTNSKVIVLGGGSAGWLTALFINRNWPTAEVTVVEDPNRPPIIAGESGSTTMVTLMRHLKIDFTEFVLRSNATPKVGGKFTDWNGVGTQFIHSLQTDYAPWLDGWPEEDTLRISNLSTVLNYENIKDVYLKTILGSNIPLAKAFYANYFIEENKVPFGGESDIPCVPMWHFESRAAAAYFKEIAVNRGIKHYEGEFRNAIQNNSGDITKLVFRDERELEGNWFFDCSGFARLLLGKVYNEPVIDYTEYFPARSVVAWWSDSCPCVTTNAIAMKYGWSWDINLRHRSGNGYIFDPDLITLDQAIDESEKRFNKKITPVANFTFTPGLMRNAWRNNVISIGLSSGFLEPLEANGVALIVESLFGIQDYWSPFEETFDKETINRFNDRLWMIANDIRDFLCLHYRGHRKDTKFWVDHANNTNRTPDGLREKLAHWEEYYYNQKSLPIFTGYSPTAWLMVLQGLEIFDYKKLEEQNEKLLDKGKNVLNMNTERYKKLVEPFWTVEEWLKNTSKN